MSLRWILASVFVAMVPRSCCRFAFLEMLLFFWSNLSCHTVAGAFARFLIFSSEKTTSLQAYFHSFNTLMTLLIRIWQVQSTSTCWWRLPLPNLINRLVFSSPE